MNKPDVIKSSTTPAASTPASGSAAGFKVWHASYSWHGGWGAYQEYEVIVVAESASRAHTWVVMEYKDTAPECWTINEIPTDKDGTHHISERCS